jgi:hypothetical protein
MRVLLDGLPLETVEYFEGREIGFTCFTADDGFGLALCEALGAKDVLELQRGEEHTLVRVREHEVTPPYARRCGGAVHRHTVRLEPVKERTLPVPEVAGHIPSAIPAR